MFELLFSSEALEDGTGVQSGVGDDWAETNGALLDSESDVETSADLSFGTVGADAVLASYLRGSPDPIFVVDRDTSSSRTQRVVGSSTASRAN